jgi:hypothetical protein
LALRIGIDIACRASHRAACADSTGQLLWRNVRFQTRLADLEALWERIPAGEDEITVVMEPTRNAWVPLAAWFRRHGAQVVMVPPEQSADLRSYFNKHTKTDRLDAELLARLPALHPEGLHPERGLGVAEPLRRSVKIRSNMVKHPVARAGEGRWRMDHDGHHPQPPPRRLLSVKRPTVHGLRDNRAQLLHRHQLRATDPLLNIATARPSPPTQARGAAPYPVAIATCSLRKRNNLLML